MIEQAGLDPTIHAVVRLRITSVLATLDVDDSLSFPRLQSMLDLTSGNLATHVRKLEEAGYVAVTQLGRGRTSKTTISLTDAGRTAFDTYRSTLRSMLEP